MARGEAYGDPLLASNPGYGIEKAYAAAYPDEICLYIQKIQEPGVAFVSCANTRGTESQHAMFQWTSGPSTPSFAVGFVANDVTNVRMDGVVAPVSANNFFLTPLADGEANPPLSVTVTPLDGPAITETFAGLPPPRPSDGGSHGQVDRARFGSLAQPLPCVPLLDTSRGAARYGPVAPKPRWAIETGRGGPGRGSVELKGV